jgi:hypothetical protein
VIGSGPGGNGGTRIGPLARVRRLSLRDPGAGQARNLDLENDFDWEIGEHVYKDVMKLRSMLAREAMSLIQASLAGELVSTLGRARQSGSQMQIRQQTIEGLRWQRWGR